MDKKDYIETQAPLLELTDLTGTPIPLAALWQKQPLLIFFLRHFGCALCRSHLRLLNDAYPRLSAQGASVVAITFSDAVSAAYLQYTQRVSFPLLLDSTRRAYRAFGMTDGSLRDALGPRILVQQLRQIPNGQLPYIPPGANLTQLVGSVIVDTAGMIRFHHLALPIDHYPTVEQYLAVLGQLSSSSLES